MSLGSIFLLPKAKSLYKVLIHFEWDLVELISTNSGHYEQLAEGVKTALTGSEVTIVRHVDNAEGVDPAESGIRTIYNRLKGEARSKLPLVDGWFTTLYL